MLEDLFATTEAENKQLRDKFQQADRQLAQVKLENLYPL